MRNIVANDRYNGSKLTESTLAPKQPGDVEERVHFSREMEHDKLRTAKGWESMMEHAGCNFEELFGLTNYQKALKHLNEDYQSRVASSNSKKDPMNEVYLPTLNFWRC